MSMTVRQLIEQLECYDDDLEVRVMQQPSWPFEYSIAGVVCREEMNEDTDDEDDGDEDDPTREKQCVFLVEGNQLCYGSKRAWNHV